MLPSMSMTMPRIRTGSVEHVRGFLSSQSGEFFAPSPCYTVHGTRIAWDRNLGADERRVKIIYPSGREIILTWRLLDRAEYDSSIARRREEYQASDGRVYPSLRSAIHGERFAAM